MSLSIRSGNRDRHCLHLLAVNNKIPLGEREREKDCWRFTQKDVSQEDIAGVRNQGEERNLRLKIIGNYSALYLYYFINYIFCIGVVLWNQSAFRMHGPALRRSLHLSKHDKTALMSLVHSLFGLISFPSFMTDRAGKTRTMVGDTHKEEK